MGRLVRGVEGTGCHNFYPECPFSYGILRTAQAGNHSVMHQWI
jgi:hypothetical protein